MGPDAVLGALVTENTMNIARSNVIFLLLALASTPAFAQLDLAGNWVGYGHEDAQERGGGPLPVDYLGIPFNDAGRAKALAYTASLIAMPERQCMFYTPQYTVGGPFGFKIWNDTEPVNGQTTAWHMSGTNDRSPITFYVDGRPDASPNWIHPIGGYGTGFWQGDVFVARLTHLREGYVRRNGAPLSDQTTMTFHFIRHGDLMTVIAETVDPVYLTEPLVISRNYALGTQPIRPIDTPCVPGYETSLGEGEVPHHLPGKNPFIDEVAKLYGIPVEAVLGGAETLYPAYRKKLKDSFVPPAMCTRYCGYGAFETGASQ